MQSSNYNNIIRSVNMFLKVINDIILPSGYTRW